MIKNINSEKINGKLTRVLFLFCFSSTPHSVRMQACISVSSLSYQYFSMTGFSGLQDANVYSDTHIGNHFLKLAYEGWQNTPSKNVTL